MGLTPASYNVPRTITHRAQLTNGNVTADFYAPQGQVSNFTTRCELWKWRHGDFHAQHARNLHIPFAHRATAAPRQKIPIKDGVETTLLEKI